MTKARWTYLVQQAWQHSIRAAGKEGLLRWHLETAPLDSQQINLVFEIEETTVGQGWVSLRIVRKLPTWTGTQENLRQVKQLAEEFSQIWDRWKAFSKAERAAGHEGTWYFCGLRGRRRGRENPAG